MHINFEQIIFHWRSKWLRKYKLMTSQIVDFFIGCRESRERKKYVYCKKIPFAINIDIYSTNFASSLSFAKSRIYIFVFRLLSLLLPCWHCTQEKLETNFDNSIWFPLRRELMQLRELLPTEFFEHLASVTKSTHVPVR